MKVNKKDILILAAWVCIPPTILFFLHGNFLLSIILYLVIPGIYFSIQRPGVIPKALIVSAMTMPPMIVLDYMAFLNQAWTVPTIFPFRFFQFIPLEDFLFTFWAVYAVISTFNYFFPHIYSEKIRAKRFIKSGIVVLAIFTVFLCLYLFKQEWLLVSYYDAWLLVFAFTLPTSILFTGYPSYRKPLFFVILFQLVLFLPYEITAGKLGFWTFPSSEYLGLVHILGWTFPIEEFLEWMIFFSPAALAFSKFIMDSSTD